MQRNVNVHVQIAYYFIYLWAYAHVLAKRTLNTLAKQNDLRRICWEEMETLDYTTVTYAPVKVKVYQAAASLKLSTNTWIIAF
jgi:hypothetical protein